MIEYRLSEMIPPAFREAHMALREERFGEYFFKGGRGSGKSSFVSLQLVLGLLRHPDRSAVIYRKVASTLRESVYEQMLWALRTLGILDLCEPRLMPLEIRIPATGQRILFRGADDPGKSKSIKLSKGTFGYLWFEEAADFGGMEDIRTIRAGVLRGGRGVTFFSYNPPISKSNWINAEVLLPKDGRMVHESSYLDVPPEWLGESFLAEAAYLRQSNERLWRHMYMGEAVGTGAQVFDNLQLRRPLPNETETARAVCGLDFGFAADPDALLSARFDRRRRRLYITDELYALRMSGARLAEETLRRAGNMTVHCDSADPRLIHELRQRGVNAVGVRKGAGSVREGVRFLQELDAIVIDPAACPNAVREFTGYEYRRDAYGNFINDAPCGSDHLIDAARYALEEFILGRNAKTLRKDGLGV